MNNQEVKRLWWPLIWAFFYLSWVPFLYMGKKCGNKKWLMYGIIHLVLIGILYAMSSKFGNTSWYPLLLLTYGICGMVHTYLNNLSNRDYIKFDEKYVKVLFYSIAMNLKDLYWIKSEFEVNRKYPDLLLVPKDTTKGYHSIMIEFKYLKKEEASDLEEKQKEAREQIQEYSEFEEIKSVGNLDKYTVVAVVDKIHVEKIY